MKIEKERRSCAQQQNREQQEGPLLVLPLLAIGKEKNKSQRPTNGSQVSAAAEIIHTTHTQRERERERGSVASDY